MTTAAADRGRRKTGGPASLDLALIGNCAISALVDHDGAVVWSCMPRFDGDPVFHALLDSADGLPRDGSMLVELEGLAKVEQSYEHGTAILKTRLLDAARAGHRDRRLRAALLSPRPHLPARAAGASHPPAERPSARAHHGQSARRVGQHRAGDHARQQPPALRAAERDAAADDERAADLPRRRHLVLAARSGQPAVRPRRDAVRRDRGDRARVRGADVAVLAPLDAPARAAARVAGGRDPRRDHAEAVPVRGDRRDRRRDDDQHPRGGEQRAQLGLPLLLAARCVLRRPCAEQPVRSRHDGGLPALALRRRPRLARTATCSRSTASASSASCRNRSCRTWPAIAAWGRCASATRRTSTSSTTSTATSCSARPRPSTTTACSGAPTRPTSRPSRRSASRPGCCTTGPTPACGSCARGPACTPRRR